MESLYQVPLVDDDIDGQRINGWHLLQFALVMKILNGANMEGYGQADGRTDCLQKWSSSLE
jgi:hypothetical protein